MLNRRPVLLVDDEPDILDSLAEALELEGYPVHPVKNGNLALKLLEAVKPGLVILDLNMPEMNGQEFLRHVRAHPELKEIPVVVMTAGNTSSTNAMDADAFLQKPCDMATVLQHVARFCAE